MNSDIRCIVIALLVNLNIIRSNLLCVFCYFLTNSSSQKKDPNNRHKSYSNYSKHESHDPFTDRRFKCALKQPFNPI